MQNRNAKLSAQAISVAEYADETISAEDEAALSEKVVPVDIQNGELEVIQNYQKDMHRRMSELSKILRDYRISLSDLIRTEKNMQMIILGRHLIAFCLSLTNRKVF